jgi:pyochelin biosynthetic protein PchC
MIAQTELWLHCAVPRPLADQRLICFPHAGGSASFFRDWGQHLPDIEVHAVRYPGRAERIDESSPTDLAWLGARVAEALLPLAQRPIVLFGHSMGAVVALETARSLTKRGMAVAHLFASGSRNAPLPEPTPFTDDAETVTARLVALGGTDAELAEDLFFQELVLPYVISDGRMFHSYTNPTQPRLACPVTTIVGDVDADADLRPWPALTDGEFRERTVPGDHFYLIDAPPYALLRERLGVRP